MRRRRSVQHHQHSIKSLQAVVLGKDGVGKSALTVRLLTRRFIGEYDVTLEATYRHHLVIDGQFVSLAIMDTAGKNSRDKMDTCLTFGELFFIVYSTTDRTSFDEARLLVKYIQQDKNIQSSTYFIVIVATKKDLKHQRQVEEYEGRFLAQDVDGLFYQVSISEGYDEIQEMLEEVLRVSLNREKSKGASTLSRMKEGIIVKTKSLRRKSTTDSLPAEQVRPTTLGQNTSPVSVT